MILRSANVCRALSVRVDKPLAEVYNRGSILLLRESAKSLETDVLALCHLGCLLPGEGNYGSGVGVPSGPGLATVKNQVLVTLPYSSVTHRSPDGG